MKTVFVIMEEHQGSVAVSGIFENKGDVEVYNNQMYLETLDDLHTYYWVEEWEVK